MSASIKESLRAYYRSTDIPVEPMEKARAIAVLAEVVSAHAVDGIPKPTPFCRFLVGQLRFVDPLAWVLQAALLAAMLLIVGLFAQSESRMLIVMVAAVLSVAFAVPSVFKSFESNVSEIEASCCHDPADVLVCRFALFGLADVLWMSLAAWLVPTLTGGDAFRVFLYAATPFFAFCGLCFFLSRRTQGRCVKPCAAAAVCVVAMLWAVSSTLPHWYSEASMVVWCVALAASLALAIYEARRLIASITSGGMALASRFA